jgi:hypothetical protein
VNDDVSRLCVPKDEAAALLQAQIQQGKELRRAIGHTNASSNLKTLESELFRWSQRNEQALVAIFGEPERLIYRSADPSQPTTRGAYGRRVRMEGVSASRLAYLSDAVARVDLASTKQADLAADKKRRWRAVLDHPWTIALAAPMIAAPVIAFITFAVTSSGTGSSLLTGSVICESGRPVVGVWIAASSGQNDSGFAHLGPANPSGISYPVGSTATYSYLLPHGGTYAVHVGCGGDADAWDSRNYSPLLSGVRADLRCDDPTTLPTQGISPRGTCAATANS